MPQGLLRPSDHRPDDCLCSDRDERERNAVRQPPRPRYRGAGYAVSAGVHVLRLCARVISESAPVLRHTNHHRVLVEPLRAPRAHRLLLIMPTVAAS